MTKRERLAQSLMRPLNPSIIIILGIYTIFWGVWLANPFWDMFTIEPKFRVMLEIAPETIWGLTAIIIGLVTCRGAIKPKFQNLSIGALLPFVYWLFTGILLIAGNWQAPMGFTALFFGIYSALVWLNINSNRDIFQ